MSKIFIKRPILAIVISLMISLVGLLAIFQLPIARYPQITPPQVRVNAMYVGASADVVNTTVASVIEEQLMGVENMDYMVSTSSNDGSYGLSVIFNQGSDADIDAVNVQNRVAKAMASLPQEVQAVGVTTEKSAGDMAFVFSLNSPNATYDSTFLKSYGDNYMLSAIKSVKGVGSVMSFGSSYAMRVWMNPEKMALYHVTAEDVMTAIKTQNIQAPAGTLGTTPAPNAQQFEYAVSVNGRLRTPEEFGNIIIRKEANGNLLRLKDVATVELGSNYYGVESESKHKPVAGFAVSLTADANALQTVNDIKALLQEQSKAFPEDLTYEIIVDNTKFVTASLNEVMHTFIEALILVAVIVYLFLQSWRSTLIPMIAVPVSLLGTFAIFIPLGFTINTLTLFAMVLAIGLVVDDAIVVIEAVEFEMQTNELSPKEATFAAMSNVQNPVIAVALVLSAIFVPVAFMGGITGVLYKQFALTIAISVMVSAFVALTLTPALCATMLKPHAVEDILEEQKNRNFLRRVLDTFNDWMDRFTNWYGFVLAKFAKHTYIAIVILLVCMGVSGYVFKVMPRTFVPSEDGGYYMVAVNLPPGAALSRTKEVMNKLQDYAQADKNVDNMLAISGFDIMSSSVKSSGGLMFVPLKSWEERKGMENSVFAEVGKMFMFANAHVPEATVMPMNPPALPGLGSVGGVTAFLINKQGDDVNQMIAVSNDFVGALRKDPKFSSVYTSFNNATPSYTFTINRDKAAQDGVAYRSILSALQGFYGSAQVNEFTDFGKNYKVIIQADEASRMSPAQNDVIKVRSANGNMYALSNYITATPNGVASNITRFNNYPAIKLNITAAQGVSSGEAIEEVRRLAESLPKGYALDWGDQAREEVKSGSTTMIILGLGFVFVFLILAALYESWKVPFSVLLSVPSGIIGASLIPYLLHLQNSVYVQIGLLALVGLAAKNAILIVEYAKVRVDEKGMPIVDAAIEAAKIRLRPIVMTSLAFILGCIPLAVSSGAGAISRISMGGTVVAGMTTATVIGIFVIPILFIIVEKIGFKKK